MITIVSPKQSAKAHQVEADWHKARIKHLEEDLKLAKKRLSFLQKTIKALYSTRAQALTDRVREYAARLETSGTERGKKAWTEKLIKAESAYRKWFDRVTASF
jgi:DNA repair exonuclease SbcCD ATPase subunit